MDKAIKAIQAVILLVVSFMALVERPGEGEQKKAEVLAHLDETFKAGGIVLPGWMSGTLKVLLPGLVNMFAAWSNSLPNVKDLFAKVQAVLVVAISVMTLTDADQGNDQDLNAAIHTAIKAVGVTLPNWAEGALGVVLPILVSVLKGIGVKNLGK